MSQRHQMLHTLLDVVIHFRLTFIPRGSSVRGRPDQQLLVPQRQLLLQEIGDRSPVQVLEARQSSSLNLI